MTLAEFSDRFDVMLSSYSTRSIAGDIEFDEYEKSLFLTKAQQELVISFYNGRNPYGEAFEGVEEIRRYLSNLIVEASLTPISATEGDIPSGVSKASKFFTLPQSTWFITYEAVTTSNGKCSGESTLRVYPVKQDEYQVIKDNPFRGANDRRALRLDLAENRVEIVCKYTVSKYNIRYIKKIPPIILIDLPDGLTIEKESKASECVLHEALHQRILDMAVQLALQSKGYSMSDKKEDK